MTKEDLFYFNLLKKAIVSTFLKTNKASNSIEKWKGEEITTFQEDLYSVLKTKVSEKWFYTYFKNTPNKLPRIDMLNLLSKYVGYKDWNTFKNVNKIKKKQNHKKIILISGVFMLLIFLLTKLLKTNKNNFNFCFIDNLKNEAITTLPLDIKILQENQSPIYLKTDSLGCFNYETKNRYIKFIVQSPYHKTDTIARHIDSNTNKTIPLKTDDYALMLYFYSNTKIKDWNVHKKKLGKLISNDAEIYQLFGNNIGIEIYSKEDFIKLITTPTPTLRQVEILSKKMKGDKIVKLKFILK